MYLKRIDVQGFKSFANKLVFEFDNGITGIVGPNGSGKSNISDAVRWVLGEQSAKQLRSSKMEDVIFAGTETRKPVSFASVSLTIDNADHMIDIEFDEVTVTRRVFRSGESEYLLNGNTCRLKDIHELFYDTGIGKDGYSIIGQGQIDKILSGKPDERRDLFDEAAGIVKFKRRKIEAQRSLDNESNNLIRISDILAELEKQVGPLAKQSEKAREYLRLKEELKKYEVNLFLVEAESLKKNIAEVTDKLDTVNNDITMSNNEFEEIKTKYDEKDAKIQEIGASIEEKTAARNQAEIDKNRLENQIEILKEQIKSANSNDEHIAERIKSINDQIEERNEEKTALLKQKFALSGDIDDALSKKNEADKAIELLSNKIAQDNATIEEKKNSIFENLNQKGIIRSNIQRYQTMIEQIGIRKAEINSKLINFKTDENQFDSTLSASKKILDAIENELKALVGENNKLLAEEETLKTDYNIKNQKLSSAKEQSMRANSRLETLKNIAERYDGYGNSIVRVMECKKDNPGLIGVVADIVKTEKKYEIAIETALGGTIQNIVTDTEDTAKKMIAYLKNNRYGRATFLPLNAISTKGNKIDISKSEQGFIGFASDLVTVDTEFKNLSLYLLGRVVVCDNIENALKIARKFNHSLKIVTLEGELLNPGGSLTGGAFKNSSNLLGRRREIEELEEIISKTDKAIVNIEKDIATISARRTEIAAKLESNSEAIKEKTIEKNTANIKYDQAESKQNEIKTMYEDNKREATEIDKQVSEINEALALLNDELNDIETYNEETTTCVEEMTKEVESLTIQLADRNKLATEANIAYSEISQKSSFIEESIKRALREIEHLKESIEALEDNKVDSVKEIETKNSEINSILETIEIGKGKISELDEELSSLKDNKEKLSQDIKSFFDLREECRNKLTDLEKEKFRLEQNKEKMETTRDERINYMWNEYEITLIQAEKLKDEEIVNESEIKKNVSEIKSNIKKLGDVNVNSIEDYKEVSERYEFLKGQHDDLIEAKEKLIAVIAELDTGMRARFNEKFEQIKVEFDKVFKQLFGGGKGTIELEPDVDVLDAAITIISQPPGKKLQNMMQLSGGEKALTAICLLFAIQNLKPSPFCLLDEIEAALDDNNVDRYAKYLHNLTKHTQFIVITHRRGTMAAADRLYGITMQEKGVSTLVSVDLIENQLEDKAKN